VVEMKNAVGRSLTYTGHEVTFASSTSNNRFAEGESTTPLF
jgi:hypothetical protein